MIMYAIFHNKIGGSVMHKQKSTRGIIKNDIEKIKAVLAMTAKDVRGQATSAINEKYENLVEGATAYKDNIAEFVGEKPYKSIALASFVGLAFGLVMRRKKVKIHR
jgi:ElaB/YqjD/DUF883 family membrane-anchored ribosome-binding protein